MKNQQTLSPDQKQVLTEIMTWVSRPNSTHITVGGYAGTGKTTMIGLINLIIKKQAPNLKVAYATFTGKASQILKTKLQAAKALTDQDYCGTIHSLMYTPKVDDEGRIANWFRNKKLDYHLLVIDEASMLTQEIWNDLLSYGLPIIAVGDHGQLPPIGDSFNLMATPQLVLSQIHRQASESPIIQVATMARETGLIPEKKFANNVFKVSKSSPDAEEVLNRFYSYQQSSDTLVLCGRNKTRVQLNTYIRSMLGYTNPQPRVGEAVICLKNNYDNPDGPIYNGMIGYIKRIIPDEEHWYEAEIDFPTENRKYKGRISKHQFNQETYIDTVKDLHYSRIGDRFDFGYALTVHKAQGSQAESVIVYEERSQYWSDDDWRRWLYTAVTRAQKNLYIFS